MKKTIRFHADDYGWDNAANAGILRCVENGLLDGVSIMSTHTKLHDLVKIKETASSTSLGLHFTLSKGNPMEVSNTVFLNERGELHSSYYLSYLVFIGKIKKQDIQKEFLFQLHRLYDAGIRPTYLDSHQHIHALPFINKLLPELIEGTGIQYIRYVNPFSIHDFRRVILKTMNYLNQVKNTVHWGSEVLITETLSDRLVIEDMDSLFLKLSKSHYQTFEFMWHPATKNREDSFINRINELHLLIHTPWEELLSKYKINRPRFNITSS
jgi:predicted glycoside hydrolase/deacetylase ChbG (UPF0249 family)